MDPRIATLAKSRYISITSYRRDGRAVATPVWFAPDGDRVVVWTDPASGKAKRIRAGSRVTVAACDIRGRVTAAAFDGQARILAPSERARSRALLAKRYRLLMPLIDFYNRASSAVRRRPAPAETFIDITLIPTDGAAK
jgi:PPOX class probable F420-dependent enzyme